MPEPKLVARADGVTLDIEDAETFLATYNHKLGDELRFYVRGYPSDGVLELDADGVLVVRVLRSWVPATDLKRGSA